MQAPAELAKLVASLRNLDGTYTDVDLATGV